MLNLREYQSASLDALRQGFAKGKRAQVLYAPTGAGKTEMAIALLDATQKKNNRAAMLLDRIVLCDQTSVRLDKYSIPHGVLQAGHWRYQPYQPIQVCSAQTMEKRGSFPGLKLLIVDECHAVRKQTADFIKNNPDIMVIGLSATPFTKGLASVYDNVVSVVTTRELVESKVLVPLRVFVAKEMDMTGVKKTAGEWNQGETEKRGMQITGDVVAEWIKKTTEVFGGPRKTIVFSSGVNHAADLASKFQSAGYNFVAISYKDDDEFKRQVIDDFAKPDTDITGLIACDILTKGFDVPDVMIGVSARPFSKSLSSHIQQMGRVMRGAPGKEFALWLDHSGNYLRFKEDWDAVYENGVSQLDDGREKAKKEKTQKEKEAAKCPVCGALWPGGDTCAHCGHVRQSRSLVHEVAGELHELDDGRVINATRIQKQNWWSMCQYKVRYAGWSSGRAAHTFKDRFGVWPRGLIDNEVMMPDIAFERFAKAKLIRFLKGQGRGLR